MSKYNTIICRKKKKIRTKVSEIFTSVGELCMIIYNYVYFKYYKLYICDVP